MVWCLVKHRDNFTFYLDENVPLKFIIYIKIKIATHQNLAKQRINLLRNGNQEFWDIAQLLLLFNRQLCSKRSGTFLLENRHWSQERAM
jgi:hypothetical protein